jgi:hypothetical protein
VVVLVVLSLGFVLWRVVRPEPPRAMRFAMILLGPGVFLSGCPYRLSSASHEEAAVALGVLIDAATLFTIVVYFECARAVIARRRSALPVVRTHRSPKPNNVLTAPTTKRAIPTATDLARPRRSGRGRLRRDTTRTAGSDISLG